MKILVLTKQVPDVAELRFDERTRTVVREGVPAVTNPYDRRAFPQAAALRAAHTGEVVVATMGPPQAVEALRDGLACGADRAVHLVDRAFAGADTLATSRALAAFCARERPFDLVLTGRNSTDGDTGHVGPQVAELLSVPCVSDVCSIEIDGSAAVCDQETEDGFRTVRVALPAVVTCAERLIRPYKPKPEEKEAAAAAPVEVLTAADLGLDPSQVGSAGSPTVVRGIEPLAHHRELVERIEGDPDEIARRLEEIVTAAGVLGTGAVGSGAASRFSPAPPDRPAGDAPASVWVLAATAGNRLWRASAELLAPARSLAAARGSALGAIVFEPEPHGAVRELGHAGADEIVVVGGDGLHAPEARAEALVRLLADRPATAVLAPSLSEIRDVLPRVCARLGLGMTADCIGFEVDAEGALVQHKPAFGGTFSAPIVSRTRPEVATGRPGVFAQPRANPAREPVVHRVTMDRLPSRTQVLGYRTEVDPRDAQLDDAPVVVAVGMGVGDPAQLPVVQRLADALGAGVGATRRAVDAGWFPRQVQIGLTGKVVAPRLYIAIGVRGSFNHVVGMHRSDVVVALNNDPDAEMFAHATYAVVADWAEVVPRLTERLLARTAARTGP